MLSGIVSLCTSIALLLIFRPRGGQVIDRAAWIDTSVAILFSGGVSTGLLLFAFGVLQVVGFQ
jgi:hypothetical protein